MFDHKVLDLVSSIGFTWGALAFSTLVLMYFRQRQAAGSKVLAAFTAACAAAFITNLALRIATERAVDSPLVPFLAILLGLTTSLLPPLVFHLIYTQSHPQRCMWRFLLIAVYMASVGAAFVKGLDDANLWSAGMAEWLANAPALSLAVSAGLALTVLAFSRRESNHTSWNRALLASMLAAAVLNLSVSSPWATLLPDYLLLAFFSVTLYYEERLMFFDLLIKRGAFFAAALLILPPLLMLGFRAAGSAADWQTCWVCAFVLAPCWLFGPWAYGRLEGAIDRGWLRRRFSIPDAEQRFIRDLQLASTEDDLRSRSAASLGEIFQAPAHIDQAASSAEGLTSGRIHIDPRPDGMPFLSDDQRLLQSLARTLGVVFENVRFREREHHLQWLASRAELKALRAQMNPHFLFNALNAIAGLIVEQPQLADETIEQLAHVLRYALRQSENEWVRLDEEIEFVTAYLRVEQARFGERLAIEFGVDHDAASVPVPAMTIQPLVENAIKHGVSALEGRGKIGVKAVLAGDLLCVEVSDNGPGFPPNFTIGNGGHGLRNVAERISGYYGSDAKLCWENGAQETHVFLNIPRQLVQKNGSDAHSNRG